MPQTLPPPRKRFGQHFLHDPRVLDRIVAAIAPAPDQHLVEIGPGRGALTERLVGRCRRLDLVELDRDLAAMLLCRYRQHADVGVWQADALDFDFRGLASTGLPLRVVGNLPYNISTPLLFHLYAQSDVVSDMHFMLQKEVVDRLAATPGSKVYGRLSVMTALHCRVERLFDVAPGAFTPPPRVMSAVVRLVPHAAQPDVHVIRRIGTLVAKAFGQRRKTLRNSLGPVLNEAAIRAAGIDPGARPETLDLAAYQRLAARLPVGDEGEPVL